MGADVGSHATGLAVTEFLVQDGLVEDVVPAAVLLGVSHAQVAQIAHLQEDVPRHLARFFPLVGMRGELVDDEIMDGLAEHLVLLLEQLFAHGHLPIGHKLTSGSCRIITRRELVLSAAMKKGAPPGVAPLECPRV